MTKAFFNIFFNNSNYIMKFWVQASITPIKFPKYQWLNHLLTRSGNDWTQVGQKYFIQFTSVFRDTLVVQPPACGHRGITSCGASIPDSVAYNNHPETPKLAQLRKKPLTWARPYLLSSATVLPAPLTCRYLGPSCISREPDGIHIITRERNSACQRVTKIYHVL